MHDDRDDETVDIRLYGSLSHETGGLSRRVPLSSPTTVDSVILQLGIAPQSVRLAMVNHRASSCDTEIRPGDTIALFPVEYPFFADWKDFWTSRGDDSRDFSQ